MRNTDGGTLAVDQVANSDVDFVKVPSSLKPGTYFAIADECRKLHISFVGHVPDDLTVVEASNAGWGPANISNFACPVSQEKRLIVPGNA